MAESQGDDPSNHLHKQWERRAKHNISYKETSPKILPKEVYRVSDKLTIEAIPLEYARSDVLAKHGEAIKKSIQGSDGVVFEYFPDEIQKIRENALIQKTTNVEWFMPYFQFAAHAAKDAEKPAFVFDPAHDFNFMVVRGLTEVIWGLGSFASFLAASRMKQIGSKFGWNPAKTQKVETASVISGIALGAFGLLQGTARTREHLRQKPNTGLTESNLRRVIVAKGIQNFAKQLDADPESTPKKLLLLYPPVHWKGIREYLDNPQKLNRAFRIASAFKVGGLRESCFTMRQYEPQGQAWKKMQAREIR
jgi:hypothetical protein